VQRAGFVVEDGLASDTDATLRLAELQEICTAKLEILDFSTWAAQQAAAAKGVEQVAAEWLTAYLQVLCLERKDRAPIDEPTSSWVQGFGGLVDSKTRDAQS